MPSVIQGAQTSTIIVTDRGYDSKYPLGMDIKPGSSLHTKIITEVMRLADSSWEVMSKRHTTWNTIDDTLKCYN